MMAQRFGVPFRLVEHDTAEVRPFVVGERALAAGSRLDALPLAERAWVGGVRRGSARLTVESALELAVGDRVDVYCEPRDEAAVRRIFEGL